MLTCMRVRRQLWVQLRRSGQPRIGVISNQGFHSLPPNVQWNQGFHGAGLGLGFRVRGYASEAGPSSVIPPQPKGLPPESAPDGRVWWIGAGAGTIALLGVLAVSTDVLRGAAPDTAKTRVESGFSAVWSSGAGIGRELMKMAGSVKDASVRSFVDFVEAVASIWVLARCISSILESAVDNASSEVASWWRPRVASFLAGNLLAFFHLY